MARRRRDDEDAPPPADAAAVARALRRKGRSHEDRVERGRARDRRRRADESDRARAEETGRESVRETQRALEREREQDIRARMRRMFEGVDTDGAHVVDFMADIERYSAENLGKTYQYGPALANFVLERISDGDSLGNICEEIGFPARYVRSWAVHDIDGFRIRYEKATEMQMEAWADKLEARATRAEGDSRWAKLEITTRQWLMTKLNRSKFGDRVTVDSNQRLVHKEITPEMSFEEAAAAYADMIKESAP